MMYPILYDSSELSFEDNGIGILSDAIKCTVTEERNGKFECTLQYPLSGIHFSEINLRRIILAKPNPYDRPQPFRIYRITKPMGGVVSVYSEHISYDMNGIPAKPYSADNVADALKLAMENAVSDIPFQFFTDKDTIASLNLSEPRSLRSLLFGKSGSILDVYGGEYKYDLCNVYLYKARGSDRGFTIRYGKNLSSFQQDENCSNVYTGVYPFWKDESGNLIQLPELIVNAEGEHDYTRILVLDLSAEYQEAPSEDQLREKAKSYIKSNDIGIPKVSLDISFEDLPRSEGYSELDFLERVELCDTISVFFPPMCVSATAKVNKTVYDSIIGKYDSVSLGSAKVSIVDTISNQQSVIEQAATKGYIQQAINSVTSNIVVGGEKNNIVSIDNPSGEKIGYIDNTGVHFDSGSISLGGGNFVVTSDGEMTSKSGTFGGTVQAKNIQAGENDGYIAGSKIEDSSIDKAKLSEEFSEEVSRPGKVFSGEEETDFMKCKNFYLDGVKVSWEQMSDGTYFLSKAKE